MVSLAADAVDPRTALEVAVDCYRRGLCEPIPLFPSFSYEVYRGKGKAGEWHGYPPITKDGDHPAVLGGWRTDLPIRLPDRPGCGGRRFSTFGRFLWLGLLAGASAIFAITAVVGALRRRAFALESDFGQRARRRDAHN